MASRSMIFSRLNVSLSMLMPAHAAAMLSAP
jgi:hypothetical protein